MGQGMVVYTDDLHGHILTGDCHVCLPIGKMWSRWLRVHVYMFFVAV